MWLSARSQLFVKPWDRKYPTHPWVDSEMVHPATKSTNESKGETRKVRRMGQLVLQGLWVDITDAHGTPITVQLLKNSDRIDAGAFAEDIEAKIVSGPCQLVQRSDNGVDVVVGSTGNGLTPVPNKPGQFRNIQPRNASDDDKAGLFVQVPGEVPRMTHMKDKIITQKLLHGGLASMDVTCVVTLLNDNDLKLLGHDAGFEKLRNVLDDIRIDRNTIAHATSTLATADYDMAIDHVKQFIDVCVSTLSLFDETWRRNLESAVVNACNADPNVDIELVCRSPKDFVERSHREAKKLFPDQVHHENVFLAVCVCVCVCVCV